MSDTWCFSERLLEVCLLRLAKHVWSSEDSQGRLAVVPPSLIAHLAERKAESCSVADSSILDTVSLLAWVTTNIQDTDRHGLATQALSAGQILQVRSNRQRTPQ